jgi:hypothetical protein
LHLSVYQYGFLALGWLFLAYLFGAAADTASLLLVSFATVVLAAPILAIGLYSATVSRIRRAQAYRSGSWLHRLRTGRIFATIFWTVFSLAAGFCSVFWFAHLGRYEWVMILLSIPVLHWIQRQAFQILASQYKEYIAVERSLRAARWAYALLLSVLFVGLGLAFGSSDHPGRLSDIMLDYQQEPLDASRSILVQYAYRYAEYYHQIKAIGFNSIYGGSRYLQVALSLMGAFGIFYSVGTAFSAFSLPIKEYRRIALPVEDTEYPGMPQLSQIVFASAVITVVLVFIYIPGLAGLEAKLTAEPAIRAKIAEAEKAALPVFERIEDRLFKQGTIEEIRKLQLELVSHYEHSIQELIPLAEEGYREMRLNVDGYLDWYYSLPAEYLRIASLMTGSLEHSIRKDLTESLEKGDPFGEMEKAMDRIIADNTAMKADFEDSVSRLMVENEVVPAVSDFGISEAVPLANVMSSVDRVEVIDVKLRAAGAGVGAVTGIVAAKVVGKAVAKGTVKLAAKAIAKAAVSKGASATAGAGAGALLGSIIPGAGTLVGAAVGATIGLVVGVSVDALLLKVEEVLSREEFRREILVSIDEARLEFYTSLGLEAP